MQTYGWRNHPAATMWREFVPALGDEALHVSHQSNLIRKDPEFYRPLFGDVPDDLPYIWPSSSADPTQPAAAASP